MQSDGHANVSCFRAWCRCGDCGKSCCLSFMISVIVFQGLIFRFKFLMMTTLLCAALTVIFFIISQVSEGSWKWGDDDIALEYSSAFLTGQSVGFSLPASA